MEKYDFEIIHGPGRNHGNADAMSRNHVEINIAGVNRMQQITNMPKDYLKSFERMQKLNAIVMQLKEKKLCSELNQYCMILGEGERMEYLYEGIAENDRMLKDATWKINEHEESSSSDWITDDEGSVDLLGLCEQHKIVQNQ